MIATGTLKAATLLKAKSGNDYITLKFDVPELGERNMPLWPPSTNVGRKDEEESNERWFNAMMVYRVSSNVLDRICEQIKGSVGQEFELVFKEDNIFGNVRLVAVDHVPPSGLVIT